VVGGRAKGQGPDGRADAIEQQVAARWITGQADGHRHYCAQAVDEAETQHPDVGMAAHMLQCTVAHHLPAWFARQQFASMATPHEVPELVAGVAAEEGHQHHQVDIHVSAERQESGQHQDGLAFKERT